MTIELLLSKSKKSTNAIERLYITMRYLFNRGKYSPKSTLGKTLKNLLLVLKPEIYGSIDDKEKVELNGLIYIIDRLPKGIESCQYILLTTNEGYIKYNLNPIIAPKRRRNCYRIDKEQINIEITRGRSDIYDILTHLTFLFIESKKIMNKAFLKNKKQTSKEWKYIKKIALNEIKLNKYNKEVGLVHLSSILGRTFEETMKAYTYFQKYNKNKNRLFQIIYWMGKKTFDEEVFNKKRIIYFSKSLRDRIGHHFYGEVWAKKIKNTLKNKKLLKNKNLHIISANNHSVINILYASKVLDDEFNKNKELNIELYKHINNNKKIFNKILLHALKNGLTLINDKSGTNIDVQIIDLSKVRIPNFLNHHNSKDILIVMDYAFGEQAFEVMDELLKPYKNYKMKVKSISIIGKAGVLYGKKGDIMIPSAHILEGHTDNYPFYNSISTKDFKDVCNIKIYEGPMITVLGTSLQNKNVLKYFKESTWKVIGLEMEGAHYQKAIQAASYIRNHISKKVIIRYAYYASDNPLKTGSTLSSGNLGVIGVKPTYIITEKILKQIII